MKKLLFFSFMTLFLFATQAVVFDYGDVLASPDREMVVQFLCNAFQLNREEFNKINKINQEEHLLFNSGVSEDVFWREFGRQKGVFLPKNWEESYASIIKDFLGANKAMFALVEELKQNKIRVGLFSNVGKFVAEIVRKHGLYKPFDPCLLSCEIGVEKPDAAAYKILLDTISLPPSDVVFIDDRPENIEAAKKAGIDGIVFKSYDQIRLELYKRGLLKENSLKK